MSEQNIFGGSPTPVVPPAAPSPLDTKLDEIKNEQGARKYDTIEKALDALKHSQEYIPSLKAQLEEKERLLEAAQMERERVGALEDIVAKLTAQQAAPPQVETPKQGGLDEQKVLELVQQTLTQTSRQQAEAANENSVKAALISKFGDKAADVVTQKAAELGISTQEVQELSKKKPALVLAAFGIQAKPTQPPTPTTSSVNIPPVNAPQQGVQAPQKSVLSGATMKEQASHFAEHRRAVYEKLGVTTT